MVKVVTLFLIFMAVLAMFGRLRLPKIMRGRGALPKPSRCAKCGRINLTGGDCTDCKGGRGKGNRGTDDQ